MRNFNGLLIKHAGLEKRADFDVYGLPQSVASTDPTGNWATYTPVPTSPMIFSAPSMTGPVDPAAAESAIRGADLGQMAKVYALGAAVPLSVAAGAGAASTAPRWLPWLSRASRWTARQTARYAPKLFKAWRTAGSSLWHSPNPYARALGRLWSAASWGGPASAYLLKATGHGASAPRFLRENLINFRNLALMPLLTSYGIEGAMHALGPRGLQKMLSLALTAADNFAKDTSVNTKPSFLGRKTGLADTFKQALKDVIPTAKALDTDRLLSSVSNQYMNVAARQKDPRVGEAMAATWPDIEEELGSVVEKAKMDPGGVLSAIKDAIGRQGARIRDKAYEHVSPQEIDAVKRLSRHTLAALPVLGKDIDDLSRLSNTNTLGRVGIARDMAIRSLPVAAYISKDIRDGKDLVKQRLAARRGSDGAENGVPVPSQVIIR